MFRRWLATAGAVLVAGALVELALLGLLVYLIGPAWTIGLLIIKSVIGYLIARRVGRRGWRQFRAAVDSGRPPGREGTDAAVAFGGAMLVLLGGFLGATIGLVLLVPPVRRWGAGLAERVVERQLTAAGAAEMFGPRRVRMQREAPPKQNAPKQNASPEEEPPVVEGEVLPPR